MYDEFQESNYQELLIVMSLIGEIRESYIVLCQDSESNIDESHKKRTLNLLDDLMDNVWAIQDLGDRSIMGSA